VLLVVVVLECGSIRCWRAAVTVVSTHSPCPPSNKGCGRLTGLCVGESFFSLQIGVCVLWSWVAVVALSIHVVTHFAHRDWLPSTCSLDRSSGSPSYSSLSVLPPCPASLSPLWCPAPPCQVSRHCFFVAGPLSLLPCGCCLGVGAAPRAGYLLRSIQSTPGFILP
jgi:hypothetical protein